MSDPEKSERQVVVSPAVVLPEGQEAAKARIAEIRNDERLAVEETVLQTSPLLASLDIQTIRREVMMSSATLLQKARGREVATLSTSLSIADLKLRAKIGQIELIRVSLDESTHDLSQKCISIVTKGGHKFTAFNVSKEVVGIMVEENQAELFS